MVIENKFTVWDYSVFVFTLVASSAVGIYYAFTGGRQKTTREIFLGNREMSAIPVASSLLGSFMSAVTLLGLPSETYVFGWEYWQVCLAFILVILTSNYLYLPVFYHYQLTSTFEYFERRFNKLIRIAGSLSFIIQMLLYMGIVLYAPSLAINAVTGFSITASILSIGIVCTFYTAIGGMKAVLWTNVLQIVMMFAGIMAIIFIGAYKVGGLDVVFTRSYQGGRIRLFNYNPNPFIRHTFWTTTFGGFLMWLSIFGVNQSQVQRCLSCSSLKVAKFAMLLNIPGLVGLMTICVLSGLVLYALYESCDPLKNGDITKTDQLLPFAIMDLLYYPGIPGLFISSLFSGSLSTMSSGVNSIAAVIMEDIVKVYYPTIPESTASLYSKALSILFGVLLVAMAFLSALMGTILQAALTIFGMVGGPLLGLFTLGMFVPWANSTGSFWGWAIGSIVTMWLGIGNIMYKEAETKLPVSIEGCLPKSTFTNASNTVALQRIIGSSTPFFLYRISYLHLTGLSLFFVIGIGMLISYITGFQDPDKLDPYLLSPPILRFYRYLAQKYDGSWLNGYALFHEGYEPPVTEKKLEAHAKDLETSLDSSTLSSSTKLNITPIMTQKL